MKKFVEKIYCDFCGEEKESNKQIKINGKLQDVCKDCFYEQFKNFNEIISINYEQQNKNDKEIRRETKRNTPKRYKSREKFIENEIPGEVWKDIEDFEDYKVSNMGRVRSLKRNIILSQGNSLNNYQIVTLYKDNKGFTKKVHQLVANAFLKKKSDDLEINHIDNNPKNNRVDNLEYRSKSFNVNYQKRFHPNGFKAKKVLCIDDNLEFKSVGECSKHYNVSESLIYSACNVGHLASGKKFCYLESN